MCIGSSGNLKERFAWRFRILLIIISSKRILRINEVLRAVKGLKLGAGLLLLKAHPETKL